MKKDDQQIEKKRRKWFFTLLLSLTFLNCLIGIVMSFGLLFKIAFVDLFSTTPVLDTVLAEDKSGNAAYLLLKILILIGVAWGAIKMWKLKRIGFFIYLIMQMALLVIPFAFLSHLGFWYIVVNSFINLIFLVFFIMLYTLQLGKMETGKKSTQHK
jgi:hypothetical protein